MELVGRSRPAAANALEEESEDASDGDLSTDAMIVGDTWLSGGALKGNRLRLGLSLCLAIGLLLFLVLLLATTMKSHAASYASGCFAAQERDMERIGDGSAIAWLDAIAAMGMYGGSERVRHANGIFWRHVRTAFLDELDEAGIVMPAKPLPQTLRSSLWAEDLLTEGRLVFGQFCGYPWATSVQFRANLQLLAAPVYDSEALGCAMDAGFANAYCSHVVVADDSPYQTLADLRGTPVAINDARSNTGLNLLRALVADLVVHDTGTFFSNVTRTGGHVASIEAVLAGSVATAAIDAVTLAHYKRDRPAEFERLRIVATTQSSPTGPFLMSAHFANVVADAMRRALDTVMADDDAEIVQARADLLLVGIERVEPQDYLSIVQTELDAVRTLPFL